MKNFLSGWGVCEKFSNFPTFRPIPLPPLINVKSLMNISISMNCVSHIKPKHVIFPGVVVKRYPTTQSRQGTLIKCTISPGPGETDSINVFFMGALADQSDIIAEADILVLNEFHVENNTNTEYSKHACQIVVDRMRLDTKVWIVHDPEGANKKKDVTVGPGPSTSTASDQQQGEASGKNIVLHDYNTVNSPIRAHPLFSDSSSSVRELSNFKHLRPRTTAGPIYLCRGWNFIICNFKP